MFYPAKMKKICVVALDRYRDRIVERLHVLGTIELLEQENRGYEGRVYGEKGREQVTGLLRRAEEVLDFLSPFETVAGKGSILKMLLERPAPPVFDSGILSVAGGNNYLRGLSGRVRRLRERLGRLESELERVDLVLTEVQGLLGLDVDLSRVRDTEHTFSVLGRVLADSFEELKKQLVTFDVTIVTDVGEEEIPLLILGLKKQKEEVTKTLEKIGFKKVPARSLKGTPKEITAKNLERRTTLTSEKNAIKKELAKTAEKEMQNLLALREYLEIQLEKYEAQRLFSETKRTFTIEGYIPAKKVESTVKELKTVSEGHATIIIDETGADKNIPVHFDNPSLIQPFQLLTRAYAMPKYTEVDPTWLIALWFPLFFGIMLTDMAYGIGLFLLAWFMIWRFESQGMQDLGKILAFSSIWTIILGATFGSVFGNFFQSFFGISFGVFDPLFRADLALLFAIIIGLIHLNLGLALGIKEKLRKRDQKALVFEHLWIVLLEIGAGLLLFLGRRVSILSAILFLASIAILLKKPEGVGPLEINSFFGSSLSYARLLALSLATTGIAIAVNEIGGMLLGSFVGALFGVVILLGGHIFNFAINVFGAFVHSMRLHYVEFFSMFYEGGGREFSPFKAKRRYTKKGGN